MHCVLGIYCSEHFGTSLKKYLIKAESEQVVSLFCFQQVLKAVGECIEEKDLVAVARSGNGLNKERRWCGWSVPFRAANTTHKLGESVLSGDSISSLRVAQSVETEDSASPGFKTQVYRQLEFQSGKDTHRTS